LSSILQYPPPPHPTVRVYSQLLTFRRAVRPNKLWIRTYLNALMRLSISSIARRVAGEGGGEMRLLNRNGSTGALFLLSRLIRRTYACYNRVRAEGKDDSFPRFFQIKRCCMPGVITIIPLSLFLLRKIFQCKNITWLKIYGKITSKICLKTPGGD
jgi:hypothetical protein